MVDCYSKAQIDKSTLLAVMQDKYRLQYETVAADFGYLPSMTSLEGLIEEMNAILLKDKLSHTNYLATRKA